VWFGSQFVPPTVKLGREPPKGSFKQAFAPGAIGAFEQLV